MDDQRAAELRGAIEAYPRKRQPKPQPKRRAEFEIGHQRVSDPEWPCKRCGLVRLEELWGITECGGMTWGVMPCSCKKG